MAIRLALNFGESPEKLCLNISGNGARPMIVWCDKTPNDSIICIGMPEMFCSTIKCRGK